MLLCYQIPVLTLLHAKGLDRLVELQSIRILGVIIARGGAPTAITTAFNLYAILKIIVVPYATTMETDMRLKVFLLARHHLSTINVNIYERHRGGIVRQPIYADGDLTPHRHHLVALKRSPSILTLVAHLIEAEFTQAKVVLVLRPCGNETYMVICCP